VEQSSLLATIMVHGILHECSQLSSLLQELQSSLLGNNLPTLPTLNLRLVTATPPLADTSAATDSRVGCVLRV